jgi:uncharacterized protein
MTAVIVVLADTHLSRGHDLPGALWDDIRTADMVVHLGDFTGTDLADALQATGKLVAIYGNNDPDEIRRRYPSRQDVVVGGVRIRAIHGDVGGRTADETAAAQHGADVVLYGHSHMPRNVRRDGVLLFNPGSPTRRRFAPFHSYGILEIGENVDARIVPIDVDIDRALHG